jgi:hypothetical protein
MIKAAGKTTFQALTGSNPRLSSRNRIPATRIMIPQIIEPRLISYSFEKLVPDKPGDE